MVGGVKADVTVYDASGPAGAFSPSHNASKPTGGTEVHAVQLCEGLASAGFEVRGISEIPKGDRGMCGKAVYLDRGFAPDTTRALVTIGLTRIPEHIATDRHTVLWTHDPPHNVPFLIEAGLRWSEFVCVSEWQAARFPRGWKTRVVPPMIDDWIYNLPPVEKDPGKFICVSAWWKGTVQTLQAWKQLRHPGQQLYVGSPYSHPPDAQAIVERAGCVWVDLTSPRAVVEAMRDAAGVFRVVTAAETFGVTDAIAQILGCRVHAWAVGGLGGMPEALNPGWHTENGDEFSTEFKKMSLSPPRGGCEIKGRDFRAEKIIPRWVRGLRL